MGIVVFVLFFGVPCYFLISFLVLNFYYLYHLIMLLNTLVFALETLAPTLLGSNLHLRTWVFFTPTPDFGFNRTAAVLNMFK